MINIYGPFTAKKKAVIKEATTTVTPVKEVKAEQSKKARATKKAIEIKEEKSEIEVTE